MLIVEGLGVIELKIEVNTGGGGSIGRLQLSSVRDALEGAGFDGECARADCLYSPLSDYFILVVF